MEPTQMAAPPTGAALNSLQTDPQHQYVTVAGNTPPAQTPAYSPQYAAITPDQPATNVTSQVLAAGMFGLIVVATGTMGANLHKVQDGDMTMREALNNSLVKGAAGGVAAATGTAASATLTAGSLAGLAVTLIAATGVSYLISNERNCVSCVK